MFKKIALLMMCLLVLPVMGCKTTIDPKKEKIVIEGDGHGHPHDGGFCPPGQAKKDNC